MIKAAVRPSFGTQFMASENGSAWEVTGGGEFFGYGGKLIGAYANVKQTWQSEALVTPDYFTMEEGKVWKSDGANNVTNTEWRGGISVAWKWGDFGVYKDRPVWGNAEHGSNILSGHAPSFPFISLHLKPAKWIEFQYIHGWLNSNVVDSSKSTFAMDNGTVGNDQLVYRKKYIAANMLTLTPWRGLDFSLGNSIIYSDENPNPWYLIPVLFYNSVDATKSDYVDYNGSNSQLFFDISSRQIRHLHLYLVLYVDEWKMSRALNKNQHNFTSLKGGFKLSDFPFRNATFTTEYTRTQPMTYDHYIPTTVFSSDSYILGNYLRENSQELFFSISFHPYRSLSFAASYTIAQHGQEAPYRLDAPYVLDQVPFLKNKTWQDHSFEFSARYEFVNKVSCFIRYMNSIHEGDVAYQPIFMHGKTNLFNAGVSVGF